MSSVTSIFGRGHVELFGGIISAATTADANGTRPDFRLVGEQRFYVDRIEQDGGRLTMWDGASYEEAIREAESLARESAIHVVDRVVGRQGGS